jgi:predicted SnoaL-like aldol condensation-catalyzing enzyme
MIREDGGAAKFFNFGLYIQHNRDVGDGLNGLLWGMLKMKLQGNTIKFKHNYHIIAEGNFVLSATEGYMGEEKFAYFDLFRIEENKIVEHWDIIAPIDKFLYYQPEEIRLAE